MEHAFGPPVAAVAPKAEQPPTPTGTLDLLPLLEPQLAPKEPEGNLPFSEGELFLRDDGLDSLPLELSPAADADPQREDGDAREPAEVQSSSDSTVGSEIIDELHVASDADAEGTPFKDGDFVVSCARLKCLHQVGRCYRRPGRDYLHYEVFSEVPPAGSYDKICLSCWPLGNSAPLKYDDSSAGSSASTSA